MTIATGRNDFADLTVAIVEDLRRRLPAAWAEYQDFMDASPPPDEARAFAARHTAAKYALQHFDLLCRLARWTEGRSEQEGDHEAIDLLAKARRALGQPRHQDEPDDEEIPS